MASTTQAVSSDGAGPSQLAARIVADAGLKAVPALLALISAPSKATVLETAPSLLSVVQSGTHRQPGRLFAVIIHLLSEVQFDRTIFDVLASFSALPQGALLDISADLGSVAPQYIRLAHAVARAALAESSPQVGASALFQLLRVLEASPQFEGMVTPAHTEFARLALYSKKAAHGAAPSAAPEARALTAEEIFSVLDAPHHRVGADAKSFGATASDVLLYYHYAGCIYASAKRWEKAVEAFEMCLVLPTAVASAIQLEAYKKLLLVRVLERSTSRHLGGSETGKPATAAGTKGASTYSAAHAIINHALSKDGSSDRGVHDFGAAGTSLRPTGAGGSGQEGSGASSTDQSISLSLLPVNMSPVAAKMVVNHPSTNPYRELADAALSNKDNAAKKAHAVASSHSQLFRADGTSGLAEQVVSAATRLRIRSLARVYSCLPLETAAAKASIEGRDAAQEAARIIGLMIAEEGLPATIDAATNAVRFHLPGLWSAEPGRAGGADDAGGAAAGASKEETEASRLQAELDTTNALVERLKAADEQLQLSKHFLAASGASGSGKSSGGAKEVGSRRAGGKREDPAVAAAIAASLVTQQPSASASASAAFAASAFDAHMDMGRGAGGGGSMRMDEDDAALERALRESMQER